MISYEYFGPWGQRRSEVIDYDRAARMIGNRVLIGFPFFQRHIETPSGETLLVAYFRSDITGKVWALYFEA
jgi:hypothetical protein